MDTFPQPIYFSPTFFILSVCQHKHLYTCTELHQGLPKQAVWANQTDLAPVSRVNTSAELVHNRSMKKAAGEAEKGRWECPSSKMHRTLELFLAILKALLRTFQGHTGEKITSRLAWAQRLGSIEGFVVAFLFYFFVCFPCVFFLFILIKRYKSASLSKPSFCLGGALLLCWGIGHKIRHSWCTKSIRNDAGLPSWAVFWVASTPRPYLSHRNQK